DGSDIPGATSNPYEVSVTSAGDNNAVFSVVVSNGAGKVSSSTATLLVFTTRYSEVPKADGTPYDRTDCVKDNISGLVWEGKNPSGSTSRAADSGFITNYDSTDILQKPPSGASPRSKPTQAEIDAPTNTIGYVNSVNASSLCGYMDWRLPTKAELFSIVDTNQASAPYIDSVWFPNTPATYPIYWTSTPLEPEVGFNPDYAYTIDFYTPKPFGMTRVGVTGLEKVRLVR
ncbi:MAG: DUF1566 domain-containing protein, partial [Rhodoferax sp.]|nr:DUF1566 domain-containing protein [Rhodoferax sp.]